MNGIEKITGKIDADIQAEIDQIMESAQVSAKEIAQGYEVQATQATETILARGKVEAQQREERLVSVAMLESRKAELATKQEMIEKAFEGALNYLLTLPEEKYITLLAGLIVKAARTGKEEIIFSQKDRTQYGKQAVTSANEQLGDKGNLTLSVETRPMKGGLVVSDGDVEINCSFETLVRLQRGIMDREVASVLFGK